jgi:hypothetical protein
MSLEHNIMSQELSELHVVVDLSVDSEDDGIVGIGQWLGPTI